MVAFSKPPCTQGPFLSPARTCISISVFGQPEGEGWSRGSLMIDSQAGPPGGLWTGCQPFPEVWGQVEIPCGCSPTGQVCEGEGGVLNPSALCEGGKSAGQGALPWHWPSPLAIGSAPLLVGQITHCSPHSHPRAHGSPPHTHSTQVHRPFAAPQLTCPSPRGFTELFEKLTVLWEGIKGMDFSSKISEES